LLDRCSYVSGYAEEVDRYAQGKHVVHEEVMGRSKAVTIMSQEPCSRSNAGNVTVQPISLQNLFIALCGGNGGAE